VVASLAALGEGHASELGAPQDQRVVEHAPGLEVDEQGGDGFVVAAHMGGSSLAMLE